ncbi:hypothetical protein OROGR_016561 [Orobanche gracilis]
MAETPSIQSPSRIQSQTGSDLESAQYWCYHCDKRVAVETLPDLPDIICYECKDGFVESIAAAVTAPAASNPMEDPDNGDELIQVLRLISQVAREEDARPPLPSDPSYDDYLHIDLGGWDSDDDDEDSVEVVREEEAGNRERYTENNRSDGEDGDGIEVVDPPRVEDEEEDGDDEEEMSRRRRDVLRLQFRNFASLAASRRSRILDWAEILMGNEDHSIELRIQVPDSDTYVGNPGDYADAAEYEIFLQNLVESDSGTKLGAPPASKAAVEGLENVVIEKEDKVIVCAICKDTMNVGEIAKNLPCGHGYHGECIIPWLGSRNTCPVCRFELPTDDPDYEEERKKRVAVAGLRAASTGSSSSGGGNNDFRLE